MGQDDSELGVRRWSVIIAMREHERVIEAKAHLFRPGGDLTGLGLVPVQSVDRPAVKIGDQLAAARALSDLATQLSAEMAAKPEAAEQTVTASQ